MLIDITAGQNDVADAQILCRIFATRFCTHQRELIKCLRHHARSGTVADDVDSAGIGVFGQVLDQDAQIPGRQCGRLQIREVGQGARGGRP